MDSDNSFQMSRGKFLQRLNFDSSQLPHASIRAKGSESTTMSPMTNLALNLSGASLDATPKRRVLSQGKLV